MIDEHLFDRQRLHTFELVIKDLARLTIVGRTERDALRRYNADRVAQKRRPLRAYQSITHNETCAACGKTTGMTLDDLYGPE